MSGYSQAHLDAAAQQMGFRDYATYSAYQQHQQMMRQGPAPQAVQQAPQAQQPQAPPQNWLQHLIQNYTPLGGAMKRVGDALGR